MSDEDYKHFVKSFLRFLQKQVNERKFTPDIIESLEVATQCLEAVYEIPSSSAKNEEEQNENVTGGSDAASGSQCPNTNLFKNAVENIDLFELFQAACLETIPDRKEKAEEIKNEGNRLMKEGKFNEALICYNKAISLDATNPVFYCNRAAARLRLSEFEKAIADCKMSLLYNPNYSKAYGRMGIAYSNLRKFENAIEVYKKALELEPDNQDYQNNLRIAQQSRSESEINPILDFVLRNLPQRSSEITPALEEMSRNRDEIMNLSRHVISQMANQYPDILNGVTSQLLNLAQAASNAPNNQNPNPNPNPNPNAGSGNTDSSTLGQQQTQSTSNERSSQNQAASGSHPFTSEVLEKIQDACRDNNTPSKD